jgi:hypothetical protein
MSRYSGSTMGHQEAITIYIQDAECAESAEKK